MKLSFHCMECATETPKPSVNFAVIDIRNDGLYEFTCPKGHKSVTILQEQKFEILFEIGAHAILDGYYREAVSSFATSLERFRAFYAKVICLSRGIEDEQIEIAWKQVSQQSERQLGTFLCSYLIETGCPPTLLSNKWRRFRNNVIHKGLIPEKKEAVEYGQQVLDLILPVLYELKDNHTEVLFKTVAQYLTRIIARAPKETKKITMSRSTIVSISEAKSRAKKLEDELGRLAFERDLFFQWDSKGNG